MKTAVAITLIVAGAALIAVPPVANLLHTRQLAGLLAGLLAETSTAGDGQRGSVYLPHPLTAEYSLGCWVAGLALAAAGVRGGGLMRSSRADDLPELARRTQATSNSSSLSPLSSTAESHP
jgi:hypothetical protein